MLAGKALSGLVGLGPLPYVASRADWASGKALDKLKDKLKEHIGQKSTDIGRGIVTLYTNSGRNS